MEYVTPAPPACTLQLAGQRPSPPIPNVPGLSALLGSAVIPPPDQHSSQAPLRGPVAAEGGGGESAARALRSLASLSHPSLAPNC